MRDARRIAGIVLVLAAALARTAAPQTPDQPVLMFTVSGGYSTGGNLWNIGKQLAFALQSGGTNFWDSVALGRRLRPGVAATLAATYFRNPHLGYNLEVGYFGLESESSCRPLAPFTPTGTVPTAIQQACGYVQGQNLRGDAVGFLGGLVYRFSTGGGQPYLRVAAGGALLGPSFVETAAPILTASGGESLVYFIADQHAAQATWMISLGGGEMLPLSPGYQLHIEIRDLIVALPQPTGPATDTAAIAAVGALPVPPVRSRIHNVLAITVGLDVVFERRRGRRY
jgi:hypothetical protein